MIGNYKAVVTVSNCQIQVSIPGSRFDTFPPSWVVHNALIDLDLLPPQWECSTDSGTHLGDAQVYFFGSAT